MPEAPRDKVLQRMSIAAHAFRGQFPSDAALQTQQQIMLERGEFFRGNSSFRHASEARIDAVNGSFPFERATHHGNRFIEVAREIWVRPKRDDFVQVADVDHAGYGEILTIDYERGCRFAIDLFDCAHNSDSLSHRRSGNQTEGS